MGFEKLGDAVYIPKVKGSPLEGRKPINFNYYLNTQVRGQYAYIDLTTKLFDKEQEYIRKVSCKVNLEEIENCVKTNLIHHMRHLGMEKNLIPKSLLE